MNPTGRDERLSRLATQWTLVFAAHQPVEAAGRNRRALMLRYGGAVQRYLLGAVRDADAAEELCQEFALRFLRGDFHAANPLKGRFRDYVKTALINLVRQHYRTRAAAPIALAHDLADPAPPEVDQESRFDGDWRTELLDRTWQALEQDRPVYCAALKLRIEAPDLSSAQMAEQLSQTLNQPVTAASVRKTLQRAHGKFADLLLDEVARSIENDAREAIGAELVALDLLRYCRSALERRFSAG